MTVADATQAPPVRRDVSICLTPWAPGTEGQAIGSDKRWIRQWAVMPGQSMVALLARLERAAEAVISRQTDFGDVEILGRVEGQPELVVLALVAYGLTADEIATALARLSQMTKGRAAA